MFLTVTIMMRNQDRVVAWMPSDKKMRSMCVHGKEWPDCSECWSQPFPQWGALINLFVSLLLALLFLSHSCNKRLLLFFSFFEHTEKKNNSCSLQHWKLILNSGLFQCLEGFYMSTETELASFIFPLISNHSHLLMSSVSSCWTTYTHIWKVPVSKLPTHI